MKKVHIVDYGYNNIGSIVNSGDIEVGIPASSSSSSSLNSRYTMESIINSMSKHQ